MVASRASATDILFSSTSPLSDGVKETRSRQTVSQSRRRNNHLRDRYTGNPNICCRRRLPHCMARGFRAQRGGLFFMYIHHETLSHSRCRYLFGQWRSSFSLSPVHTVVVSYVYSSIGCASVLVPADNHPYRIFGLLSMSKRWKRKP